MSQKSPSLLLFEKHLANAEFCFGEDSRWWGRSGTEPGDTWPLCDLWVRSDPAYKASGRVTLRFNLEGYPEQAPTAQPWDDVSNTPLKPDEWPKGPGNVSGVFRPGWNSAALYSPCDRVPMSNHPKWRETHPSVWWNSGHEITHYLKFIFQILSK